MKTLAGMSNSLKERKGMTIYEKIVALDEEMMVEFLLRFAKDTIDQFSRFQMPSKDVIREFLDRECPE